MSKLQTLTSGLTTPSKKKNALHFSILCCVRDRRITLRSKTKNSPQIDHRYISVVNITYLCYFSVRLDERWNPEIMLIA